MFTGVSLFLESGALYTCGECESGKLGLPDSLTNITSPLKVTLGVPIKSVFCGGNHTIALTGKTRFCPSKFRLWIGGMGIK
jgi:alpha-tubulin suppressor-like RCC1 family protein